MNQIFGNKRENMMYGKKPASNFSPDIIKVVK
jgi:hypothetical protein